MNTREKHSDYKDRYKEFYKELHLNKYQYEACDKKFVFGYTSNLDVLIEWDVNKFNALIEEFLKQDFSLNENDVIDSMESLVRIAGYFMIQGVGGEINITNAKICEFLEKYFKISYVLGGTCAQSAAAISTAGFPSLVHITDRSKEVCELMEGMGIQGVSDGETVELPKLVEDTAPIRHMILQFSKGDIIKANGKEFKIPESNRLIIDFDNIHNLVPIEKEFLKYCEENAKRIIAYSISGFNAIIDRKVILDKVKEIKNHLSKIKTQNDKCIIYLESACYLNDTVKEIFFKEVTEYIDILGMNEEELVELTGQFGVTTIKENFESILEGLDCILNHYSARNIVLHTKDYAISYGEDMNELNLERALTVGNILAGTRARIGKYGNLAECEATLKKPLSKIGLSFSEQLKTIETKRNVVMVPSRYLEKPICTIGLGDTFVAGFLASIGGGDNY